MPGSAILSRTAYIFFFLHNFGAVVDMIEKKVSAAESLLEDYSTRTGK